ncbi:MAG: hypothetical protein AAF351_14630 [Pseudomonadota bacterium]
MLAVLAVLVVLTWLLWPENPQPETSSSIEGRFEQGLSEVTEEVVPSESKRVFPSMEALAGGDADKTCIDARARPSKSAGDYNVLLQQLKDEALPVLSSSDNSDHRFLAALLIINEAPTVSRDQILKLIDANPPRQLAAMYALAACYDYSDFCDIVPQIHQHHSEFLTNDVLSWVAIANYYLQAGAEEEALAAMRKATSVSKVRSDQLEYLLLFDRALAASTSLEGVDRLYFARVFARAMPGAFGLLSVCTQQGASSSVWRDLCITVSQRTAADSSAALDAVVSLHTESRMHEFAGNTKLENELDSKAKELGARVRAQADVMKSARQMRDEQLIRAMYDRWAVSNEFQAYEFGAAEVDRKIESGEYPPATECAE